MTMTTVPCVTCGHAVSPNARRCPSCNEKRPAPTVANIVRIAIGLVVLVVVLIAVAGGFSGGGDSSSGAVKTLVSQEGACLSVAGVSAKGATTVSLADGTTVVVLKDGAAFRISGGFAYPRNDQATSDLDKGGPNC